MLGTRFPNIFNKSPPSKNLVPLPVNMSPFRLIITTNATQYLARDVFLAQMIPS